MREFFLDFYFYFACLFTFLGAIVIIYGTIFMAVQQFIDKNNERISVGIFISLIVISLILAMVVN